MFDLATQLRVEVLQVIGVAVRLDVGAPRRVAAHADQVFVEHRAAVVLIFDLLEELGDALRVLRGEDLGELGSRAGVKQLVATHIPFPTKSAEEDAKCVSRISVKFAGRVTIAEDLAEF